MNMKKATLAAAVAGAMGLGAAGQATASVYGASYLEITDLVIYTQETQADGITPVAPFPGVPVNPGNFNFYMTNTASLGAAAGITNRNCQGSYSAAGSGGNCGGGGSGANTVLGGATDIATGGVVGPNVVSLGLARGEDAYGYLGPGASEYATSDSVIHDASLVNDPSTHTQQIAEVELQNGTTAGASAEIQSVTGFTYSFTVGSFARMDMSFWANPDLRALINDITASAASSQANMKVEFLLKQTSDTGGGLLDEILWKPNGNLAGGECFVLSGTASCTELADGEDLNHQVSVTGVPNSDDAFSYNDGIFTLFQIAATGLDAGIWNFSLNAVTSTNVSRVPEPGMLMLLGAGLAGMGFVGRRRKKQA